MAVDRHPEVTSLDEESFEAWRTPKRRALLGSSSGAARRARQKHAKAVLRKYLKRRRRPEAQVARGEGE